MSQCYDFQKWTTISLTSITISLTIGFVSLVYGQETEKRTFQDCYVSFAVAFKFVDSPLGLETISPETKQLLTDICFFYHDKTGIWVKGNDPIGDPALAKEFVDKFGSNLSEALTHVLPR